MKPSLIPRGMQFGCSSGRRRRGGEDAGEDINTAHGVQYGGGIMQDDTRIHQR